MLQANREGNGPYSLLWTIPKQIKHADERGVDLFSSISMGSSVFKALEIEMTIKKKAFFLHLQ